MTLIEHLAELRSRLIKSILAIVAGATIAFLAYPWILDVLIDPYCSELKRRKIERACSLIITDPLEGFTTRMKVAGYAGLALALPVVLWQIWRFITPGLYPKEKKYAIPFVFSSVVLFLMGAGIAYLTFPKALQFLIDIGSGDVTPFFAPGKYLSLLTLMMIAFGLGFEFPVFLVFLQLAGMVTPQRLSSIRRYSIVGIFVVVAVATPSGDPYSLFALSVPLCIFYEVAIVIGRLINRRRAAAE